MDKIAHYLNLALDHARIENAADKPTRSRELSLAITKIEEAVMWLAARRATPPPPPPPGPPAAPRPPHDRPVS